ncbi:hypothetical protein TRAPUB_13723 [Trametes pubescens]|uniref:Uncharacterized protein n=1 Tax=Trametes pubescens TaxID=154538 RepID=A0A1M2VQ83_TRAPU|nr:hypothetical protein TRAPUB_13723 [Trametes pubescens]
MVQGGLHQECAEVGSELVDTIERSDHPNISIRPDNHNRTGVGIDAVLGVPASPYAAAQIDVVD